MRTQDSEPRELGPGIVCIVIYYYVQTRYLRGKQYQKMWCALWDALSHLGGSRGQSFKSSILRHLRTEIAVRNCFISWEYSEINKLLLQKIRSSSDTPFFLYKHEGKLTPASIMLSFLRI